MSDEIRLEAQVLAARFRQSLSPYDFPDSWIDVKQVLEYNLPEFLEQVLKDERSNHDKRPSIQLG